MKLFTAEQVYAADKFTIEKQNITSDELMERAAIQLFNWLHLRMQGAQVKIHLFCGIGNNGGDGLALARHLQDHGYNIEVYVVNYSKKRSKDFLTNLERLKERKIWPNFLEEGSEWPPIKEEEIIVDAIFGIGLNRAPDEWVGNLFEHLESTKAFVLAVDIPSGLFTESVPKREKDVLKANYTLSFQVPKLVFFLPQTGKYTVQWEVLDIGLDKQFLFETDTDYSLIGKNEILPFYRPREKYSHKGTYGHSLIIGGSYGKMGAVQLAARSCLRVGSGLVTVYIPKCGYIPLQTAIPEAMVITDNEDSHISEIELSIEPTAVGLGVGMGTKEGTSEAIANFLKDYKRPVVVDADALNLIAQHKDLLKYLPGQAVLTPHPKELERLIGSWKDDFDKLEKAKVFSDKHDCVLVIKGAHTIIIYKNKGYVNTTGNPGMATGGTGDVLTGMITGLIAQGYEPLQAALLGVYLHGRSGDITVENTGYQALLATDVIEGIGPAFLDLFKVEEKVSAEEDGNE
ncbi:NAD(P)H-hydrate dehydratase [Euzebyella marina]|uniref:Bifunctional NAD(P)H-hydrate repair enzyme n=1 Tax=Euzebyella marina TaxID=1761453 RepID=A0A3G2L567_9FLAO|nr:NAD(P)H-hydrate dehydratase [Euzebyella marina]AYN67341.1 NAD(P)H-hydrate dehydratase [Euzebyella marina]